MKIDHPSKGHRQRLRERFEKGGIDALQDYEVLELLLCQIILYADTQQTAKRLLEKYGTLKNVLSANEESLKQVKGVGEKGALMLSFFGKTYAYLARPRPDSQIKNRMQLAYSFYLSLKDKEYESIVYLCLDESLHLAYSGEITQQSQHKVVTEPFEDIIQVAKKHGARYIFVGHNHPITVAQPSDGDIAFTTELLRLTASNGLQLLDHVIVTDYDVYSFYLDGHLSKLLNQIVYDEAFSSYKDVDALTKKFFPPSGLFGMGHLSPNQLYILAHQNLDPIIFD